MNIEIIFTTSEDEEIERESDLKGELKPVFAQRSLVVGLRPSRSSIIRRNYRDTDDDDYDE